MSRLNRRAVTLIELMVSLALGAILIGVIVFVWTTSQKIVSRTTDKIVIYQNIRNILDTMEKDISNVVRTSDVEFFTDVNGNGFYDQSTTSPEEYGPLRARVGSSPDALFLAPNSVDAADPKPTAGANDSSKPDTGGDLNSVPYFFAPVLYSPPLYPGVPNFDPPELLQPNAGHRRDEFYFRSFAVVEGRSRPVLSHYRLRVPANFPQRPTLIRNLAWIDYRQNPPRPVNRRDDLAEGVADLEFDMFYKESRIFDHGQFIDAFEARQVTAGRAAIPGLDNQFNQTAIQLCYFGNGMIENTRENGVWFRAMDDDVQFGAVRPGDKLLLFGATDEPGDGSINNAALGTAFGTRSLTIEQIIAVQPLGGGFGSNESRIFIKFKEALDIEALLPALGGENIIYEQPFGAESRRTIFQQFQIQYRLGFLPGAFRIRLKYRDFRERRLIPFERIVRVLGS